MKAVILAGGRGERLRPLTDRIPKPLLMIKNMTILEHVIGYLKNHGIRDIIVTVGYKGDQIKKYLGDGKKFGVNIEYSEEKKPLGTAGCLVPLRKKLKETFILIGGDNLTKMDLKRFIEFHKEKGGILTTALFEFEEKSKWGVYNLGNDKSIMNFTEKPVFRRKAGTMIFCLEPEIFKHIPKKPKGVVNLTDHVIPELLKKRKRIYGFEFGDFWEDIGSLDDYKRVNRTKGIF